MFRAVPIRQSCPKSHLRVIIYSIFSNISASRLVRDLTDHELVCQRIVWYPSSAVVFLICALARGWMQIMQQVKCVMFICTIFPKTLHILFFKLYIIGISISFYSLVPIFCLHFEIHILPVAWSQYYISPDALWIHNCCAVDLWHFPSFLTGTHPSVCICNASDTLLPLAVVY